MELAEGTQHVVGRARGRSGCVLFCMLGELPVPWNRCLSEERYRVHERMQHHCATWAGVCPLQGRYYRGEETWYAHCHCRAPYSLQCRASTVLGLTVFDKFLQGAQFNACFEWYRPVVNARLPPSVQYVGSVLFGGIHFAYVQFDRLADLRLCMDRMSFGDYVYSGSGKNVLLILLCHSCRNLRPVTVKCCARRVRRLLQRAARLLSAERAPASWLARERRRQLFLERLYRYREPFCKESFDAYPRNRR